MPDPAGPGRREALGRRLAAGAAGLAALPALAGCGFFGDDDGAVSVFSVEPGQCFEGQSEVKAQISEVKRVDCSQRHLQEAYAVVKYAAPDGSTPDTYPGDDALIRFAEGACAGRFGRYVGVDYLDSRLFYTYLLPSARSWEDDDRSVVCFVTSPGEPLTGSVKGSRR